MAPTRSSARGLSRAVPSVRSAGGARVVGVIGGSGGVGTSCLAAALATRAALGGDLVACADAEATGGGIDALFDLESRSGARWPDLAHSRGRLEGAALLRHLPVSESGVAVLSAVPGAAQPPDVPGAAQPPDVPGAAQPPDVPGAAQPPDVPVPSPVLVALAEAVDVLVLDLGCVRAERPAAPGALALCADAVLVVGAGVPALARAAAAVAALDAVRDRSGTGRAWLAQRCPRGRADLADVVAERLGLPLLGVVLDDAQLDERLARGVPPGATRGRLAEAADRMWRVLVAQERAA